MPADTGYTRVPTPANESDAEQSEQSETTEKKGKEAFVCKYCERLHHGKAERFLPVCSVEKSKMDQLD